MLSGTEQNCTNENEALDRKILKTPKVQQKKQREDNKDLIVRLDRMHEVCVWMVDGPNGTYRS
jgi:hypothetical protein